MSRPARVTVLYNADYGPDGAPDAASVGDAARAVAGALADGGFAVRELALVGDDVMDAIHELRRERDELAFNLCESLAGDPRNEPTWVGLLELFGVRYTGSDLLALASCLYKQRTKDILIGCGVATPPFRVLDGAALAGPLWELTEPWFVKLVHEDASIGITEANVVHTRGQLQQRAGELIAQYRQPVLAERYVDGRELNVTLLGNGDRLRVLPLHEIDFSAMPSDRPHIVSYAAKWDDHHVDFAGTKPVVVRDAPAELITRCEAIARAAWHALGLRDYGRIDLRIDRDGQPWVIDINPNPDLSPDAGVARAAASGGLDYRALIAAIVDAAWSRAG